MPAYIETAHVSLADLENCPEQWAQRAAAVARDTIARIRSHYRLDKACRKYAAIIARSKFRRRARQAVEAWQYLPRADRERLADCRGMLANYLDNGPIWFPSQIVKAVRLIERCGPLVEYQLWALDRSGEVLHAGCHALPRLSRRVLRQYVAQWEAWADTVAAESPDCGTARSRRRTVYVLAYPVASQWGRDRQTFRVA